MRGLGFALLVLPLFGQEKLSRSQCEEWTRHTLKIAREDPAHPLHAALRLELSSEATEAQITYCMAEVGPQQARCQLAAQDFAGILACQKTPQQPAAEENKPEEHNNFFSELTPAASIAVNAENCSNTYDHLLQVFRGSPALQALRTHQEILRSWESPAARTAFRNRCLKRFKGHDLGCILGTRDPELIQVCLLNVPE